MSAYCSEGAGLDKYVPQQDSGVSRTSAECSEAARQAECALQRSEEVAYTKGLICEILDVKITKNYQARDKTLNYLIIYTLR